MPTTPETPFLPTIMRKVLEARHPALDVPYLRRLRALYEGGYSLLHNQDVLEDLFPRHRQEAERVYEERCRRAVYIAHASEIVDYITASLAGDPIRMSVGGADKLDDWYTAFVDDVSPPGGAKCALHTFLRAQATEMLTTQTVWARVDLPKPGEFASLADQTRAGNLDAYVVPVPAESVIDWREAAGGALVWAVIEESDCPRLSFAEGRDSIVETWTIWTAERWAKYRVQRKKDENPEPDKPVAKVPGPEGEGVHTFGQVPIIRTTLPKGLWAMDTLESPAREHFNKRSALAWAEFQSLFQELYEFKGPEEPTASAPISEAQEDPRRSTNQKRGQGYVQMRGHLDKAAFIGPSSEPFAEARKSLSELRDNMHQVMHMMAMSVDQNKTSLGRSADSKKQDQASPNVILTALGQYLREHVVAVFDMVSRGRADASYIGQWKAEGAAEFAADSGDAIIERAGNLELVPVKSPTFQRMVQHDVAVAWLGEKVDEDVLKTIDDELEENVTLDSFSGPKVPQFPAPPVKEETPQGKGSDRIGQGGEA